jgi:hypothetical protein
MRNLFLKNEKEECCFEHRFRLVDNTKIFRTVKDGTPLLRYSFVSREIIEFLRTSINGCSYFFNIQELQRKEFVVDDFYLI